jgi:hypothetical protein
MAVGKRMEGDLVWPAAPADNPPPEKGGLTSAPPAAAADDCPNRLPKGAAPAAGADAPPNSEGVDAGAAPNRDGCDCAGCGVVKEKGEAAALEAAPNRAAGEARVQEQVMGRANREPHSDSSRQRKSALQAKYTRLT